MAPAGLSTDDQSAEKTFNASIATKQRRLLLDPLNRVVETLMSAKEGPTGGVVPEQWRVQFNPLDEPNDTEDSARRKVDAETDGIHLSNGTLELHEIRTRMRNDPDQPYTLDPMVDEAMNAAADPTDPTEAAELAAGMPAPPDPDPELEPEIEPATDPELEPESTDG
jgi:hypothetical protein